MLNGDLAEERATRKDPKMWLKLFEDLSPEGYMHILKKWYSCRKQHTF